MVLRAKWVKFNLKMASAADAEDAVVGAQQVKVVVTSQVARLLDRLRLLAPSYARPMLATT